MKEKGGVFWINIHRFLRVQYISQHSKVKLTYRDIRCLRHYIFKKISTIHRRYSNPIRSLVLYMRSFASDWLFSSPIETSLTPCLRTLLFQNEPLQWMFFVATIDGKIASIVSLSCVNHSLSQVFFMFFLHSSEKYNTIIAMETLATTTPNASGSSLPKARFNWIFPTENFTSTPSSRDSISPEDELSHRQQAAVFIYELGTYLKVYALI